MRDRPLNLDIKAELVKHQARRARHRSPGPHLSQIIHRIVVMMDPKRFGNGELNVLQAQGGFIWEDVFSYVLARQLGSRQLEVEKDGIFITLDGMNTEAWRPREFKSTKMSARNPISSKKFWHWHIQGKAQCMAIGATEIEFVPIYVNGSYELAGGRFGETVAKPVIVEYTKQELITNWQMVLREKRRMDREGFQWER